MDNSDKSDSIGRGLSFFAHFLSANLLSRFAVGFLHLQVRQTQIAVILRRLFKTICLIAFLEEAQEVWLEVSQQTFPDSIHHGNVEADDRTGLRQK